MMETLVPNVVPEQAPSPTRGEGLNRVPFVSESLSPAGDTVNDLPIEMTRLYFDHKCGKSIGSIAMSASTSIRINQDFYEQARQDAALEHRTIAGQIEFWARVGRAAIDNPDLPVSFVAESLASMAEPRDQSEPFVPRSRRG